VHSGAPNAGTIGSSKRVTYTILGDSVNLAARLESINKQFGTKILISSDVANKVNSIFLLRLLMPIQVVGKEEAVKVYEAVGIRHNLILDAVLDKDEEAQSMSMASMASRARSQSQSTLVTLRHTNSGSLGENNSAGLSPQSLGNFNENNNNNNNSKNPQKNTVGTTKQQRRQAHVSKRKNAQLTARKIVENAMKHREVATIIATEIEEAFVFAFNNAANLFCDGNADACIDAIKNLRVTFPAFFEESTGKNIFDLIRLVGPERCEAGLIRAEISANVLEKMSLRAKEEIAQENNNETGGFARQESSDFFSPGATSRFVYRAVEK
jgi:hypothetical protein